MCLFCSIVSGKIPADIVYQDDSVVAFRDIAPQAPAHILVVPREHVDCAYSVSSGALWASLMTGAVNAAASLGLNPDGYRMVINNGEQAGQTIPHLHVHVLSGRAMDWPPG